MDSDDESLFQPSSDESEVSLMDLDLDVVDGDGIFVLNLVGQMHLLPLISNQTSAMGCLMIMKSTFVH